MAEVIKVRNVPAQHIGVVNSAPSPEMNIVAKEITENGRYEARTEGVTGFDPVIVNVPSREEIGYENGYAAGYGKGSTDGYADALAKRTELAVTANGEYIPEGESTGFSKVSVNLPSDSDTIDGLIDGTLSGAYRNDRVTSVGIYGFYYKSGLTNLELPNVVSIKDFSFANCTDIISIHLPKAQFARGNGGVFQNCIKLKNINIQSSINVGSTVFYNCYELEELNLPLVNYIGGLAFYNCRTLKKLVLRINTICKLNSTNAFDGCYHILGTVDATYNPEGLKDGYIYVPDDLVEDYKVATNWAIYASQIKPISELEE